MPQIISGGRLNNSIKPQQSSSSTSNYSHCPLKKRPIKYDLPDNNSRRTDSDDNLGTSSPGNKPEIILELDSDFSEPENLSVKPQDLRRRVQLNSNNYSQFNCVPIAVKKLDKSINNCLESSLKVHNSSSSALNTNFQQYTAHRYHPYQHQQQSSPASAPPNYHYHHQNHLPPPPPLKVFSSASNQSSSSRTLEPISFNPQVPSSANSNNYAAQHHSHHQHSHDSIPYLFPYPKTVVQQQTQRPRQYNPSSSPSESHYVPTLQKINPASQYNNNIANPYRTEPPTICINYRRESVISHASRNSLGSSGESDRSSPISLSSPVSSTTPPTNHPKPTTTATTIRYQCPDCQKSYSTFSGLSKHVQFHCSTANGNNVKTYSCQHCEKMYTSVGALKMHIRTHTLPCKCTICGKAFSRPWLLQGHVRTHTGEKPFSCDFCHRAFADRSNLRAHLQTHSEIKKYSCQFCSKTFSRTSLLAKHKESGCGNCVLD